MRYQLFLCSLFVTLFLSSCKRESKKGMIGEWYLTEKTTTEWEMSRDLMLLRLYPKGIYTKYGTDGYSFGQWRINDKGMYIHLVQEKGTLPYKDEYLRMAMLKPNLMEANLYYKMPFYGKSEDLMYFFRNDNKSAKDPYSAATNQWRIKPTARESDTDIKKRTVGYLQFLEAMYQHAVDNELESLSTEWYPMPLQMYFGNGVRMAYSNELYDWNNCFYDSAQAVKGYQVISGVFYDMKLKPGVNKFERNLDCVQQLLKQLEK